MLVFKAGVVGAGELGAEVARVIADADVPVVLTDIEPGLAQRGVRRARAIWEGLVDQGKLDAGELERRLALIEAATSFEGFGEVDYVIEAVPERMDVKQAVFSELDAVTPGHAILASTTSSLAIGELAEVTSRPEKVVGFHFPGRAPAGRLVEVVVGDYTSPQTVTDSVAFAQQIRKGAIRCAQAPGFVINRIRDASQSSGPPARETATAGADAEAIADRSILRSLVESCLVLEEGVAALREIELGMVAGARIIPGPFARADELGLDEVLARLERAAAQWGEAFEPPMTLRRLVAQGRLGRRTGQGFFAYPRPDPGLDQSPVKLETRGRVAIAWLDRPPANSISPEVVQALERVWAAVTREGSPVRALVFASANPMLFCAGADIKAFAQMDESAGADLARRMHAVLREMERSSLATIAAVNAAALGGGNELAMACDFRLAARSASFGQPEVGLGIIPGFGGTQRLPRLIGSARALELNLLGEPVDAAEAYELGLVHRVIEDHELLDTTLAWARRLAEQPPLAIEEIKRVSAAGDLDEGLRSEQAAFAKVLASADAREGIAAFLEKRRPRFGS